MLFRRHVGLLTGGCSPRVDSLLPPTSSSPPGPPSPPSSPQSTNIQRGLGGNWEKAHSPPTPGAQRLYRLLPHTTNCLWVSAPKAICPKRVGRAAQGGGLHRKSASGSRAPPFLSLAARGPRSKPGPKPEPELDGEGWRQERCPPSDGSETWDEADTQTREYYRNRRLRGA